MMKPESSPFEPLLKDYKVLRKAMPPLHDVLIKQMSKKNLDAAAKRLKMLDGNKFLIQCPEEITIFIDHALYSARLNGDKTLIENCRNSNRFNPQSPEGRLLAAMTRPRFTIIKLETVHPGVGCEIVDLLYCESRLLVDVGISISMEEGTLMLTRILDMGEYVMTTGAGLPCLKPLLNQTRKKFFELFDRGKLTVEGWQPEFIEIEQYMLEKALNAGGSLSVRYL